MSTKKTVAEKTAETTRKRKDKEAAAFWSTEAKAEKITGKGYGELSIEAQLAGVPLKKYLDEIVEGAET